MASFNFMLILAVLVVLLFTAAVSQFLDGLDPAFAPFDENLCENVNCGMGKCKLNSTSPFAYVCECEPGWKRAKNGRLDYYFNFLPCTYPDCSLNNGTNCEPTPPLVPEIEIPLNITDFDPCSFTNCGEGTCKNASMYQHKCECYPGFRNLLNISYFPCHSSRTLRYDRASAVIRTSNIQRRIPDEDSQSERNFLDIINRATLFLPGKLHWMAILIVSAAMAMWN